MSSALYFKVICVLSVNLSIPRKIKSFFSRKYNLSDFRKQKSLIRNDLLKQKPREDDIAYSHRERFAERNRQNARTAAGVSKQSSYNKKYLSKKKELATPRTLAEKRVKERYARQLRRLQQKLRENGVDEISSTLKTL